MTTILTFRSLFLALRYAQLLLLLLIFSACSKNRDIPKPSKVTQIQFRENRMTVAVGKSAELKVLHSPSELNPPDYDWSVSDANIARVENGVVFGLKTGETEVSISARGLGLTAKIKISVVPVLPEALRLQAEKMSLAPGEEIQLTYAIDPQDVTDVGKLELDWSSSDETVCKVLNGKVTAIGAGAADVNALIRGTVIKGSLRIQVAPMPVESVSLNVQQLVVPVGKGSRLVPKILPELATDQRMLWSSDDPLVATVIDGAVLAIKEGTTTIRVSTVDGGKTATCQVTVSSVQVERIVLSVTNLSLVTGQSYTPEVIVLPENAKDKSLRWNSSNMSVATVDHQGKVLGIGKGTAIITAVSVSNPRIQSAFQVIVVNPEEMVFTQVNATSKVSTNGYVSANLSALIENGYSVPVQFISFEVLSHTAEVILSSYQTTTLSPGMQVRHNGLITNVFRPYVKYVFDLNGKRYERSEDIL